MLGQLSVTFNQQAHWEATSTPEVKAQVDEFLASRKLPPCGSEAQYRACAAALRIGAPPAKDVPIPAGPPRAAQPERFVKPPRTAGKGGASSSKGP